jgi:phosphonoacetaldehyde hydrolase
MSFDFQQFHLTGKIQAVVLDWAGTAVDYGSMGPIEVIIQAFQNFGVSVSPAEVRQFMGMMKKDHVQGICNLPAVASRWIEKYGRQPDQNDVDALYDTTESLMISRIADHAKVIPGLIEFVGALRSQGIRIGSTTGYTRPMMPPLVESARRQGYEPDAVVCSSDVPAGRPHPFMCYQNAIQLQVYPLEAMVKIGDTINDIYEGRNAGMWTIGLTRSGNELGLTPGEIDRMDPSELKRRLSQIDTRMRNAGANYVAEGIWACLPIIQDIERRLGHGKPPVESFHE